ncbi:MAG TPA: DUF642 domain-containing protein [Armatimonadota bacterium]|jgi:hypothetical protein
MKTHIPRLQAACLLALSALPVWSRSVYSNDFARAAGPEWSNASISETPGTPRHAPDRFLGEFSTGAVTLSLGALPAHEALTVSFDLYIIRSWDGNDTRDLGRGPVGPDPFSVIADGQTLLDTTFSAWGGSMDEPQSYPAAFNKAQSVNLPARIGAAENDTLGFRYDGYVQDSIYRFSFTFPHVSSNLAVRFQSIPNEGMGNESWGLDNMAVSVVPLDNLVVNGDFEATPIRHQSVPLPGGSAFYGWQADGHSIDLAGTDFAAAAGAQCVDLNGVGPGEIYQEIATTARQPYILRFALSANPNGPASSPVEKAMNVRWNAASALSATFNAKGKTPRNPGWVYKAVRVVGTGRDRLTFESRTPGDWGPAIDDVALEPLPAEPVFHNPANGHDYQVVLRSLTWEQARATAEALTANGLPGHLATVTSDAERRFILGLSCPKIVWLGGFQKPGRAPGEGWQWVTGETWTYASWRTQEPNDAGSDENRLNWDTGSAGGWNDDSAGAREAFVVEYESPRLAVPAR